MATGDACAGADFTVIAVDQRGIGLSDKPESGYDDGNQANDMVALMDALGYERFSMIGFDTGMPIGYALATDHPERLDRLVVGEALLSGLSAPIPLIVPGPINKRLWHIASIDSDPKSTRRSSGGAKILLRRRIRRFRGDTAPRRGRQVLRRPSRFDARCTARQLRLYRAIDASGAQNQQRKAKRLTLPVLVIGGATGIGEGAANTMNSSLTTYGLSSFPEAVIGSPKRPRTLWWRH